MIFKTIALNTEENTSISLLFQTFQTFLSHMSEPSLIEFTPQPHQNNIKKLKAIELLLRENECLTTMKDKEGKTLLHHILEIED